MVVDLPEPFGPSNPNTSPRRTSKLTLSTARAFARPQKSLNTFVSPRTAMTVSADVSVADCGDNVASATGIIWFLTSRHLRGQLRRGRGTAGAVWRHFGRLIMLEFLAFAHQARAVEHHNQRAGDVQH